MAFVRHEWTTGEIITAEKLNCIESGVDCLANCSNLWTNPQPEGEFPEKSILLDTVDYTVIEIGFIQKIGEKYMNLGIVIDKRRAYKHNGIYNGFVKYGNYERTVSISDNSISFSDCKYGINYNDKLIPYSIHAFE